MGFGWSPPCLSWSPFAAVVPAQCGVFLLVVPLLPPSVCFVCSLQTKEAQLEGELADLRAKSGEEIDSLSRRVKDVSGS